MRKIITKSGTNLYPTLIVDGNYLLKKSFLGAKNQYTYQFGHIGGLFNFFLTLRRVVEQVKPVKIIVCWDHENGGKSRYLVDNRYKANRDSKKWYNRTILTDRDIKNIEDSKKSFLKQKVRICQYLEEMFIRHCEIENLEADDVIAYYCKKYEKKEEIVIYTNDLDLSQLFYFDNVKIYYENKKRIITRNTFSLFFDYHYLNTATIKTIVGDTSDNIFGVNKLGEKTLLKYFPELKERFVSVEEIYTTALKLQEKLNEKNKNYVWLDNLIDGIDKDGKKNGQNLFKNNYKLVDLVHTSVLRDFEKKLLKEEVEQIGEYTLGDVDNRGSKNLLPLMKEDGFSTLWKGTISDFFKPFYLTINSEKTLN